MSTTLKNSGSVRNVLADLAHCEQCLAEALAEVERLKLQVPVVSHTWQDVAGSVVEENNRLRAEVGRLRGVIEGWHHSVKQYVSADEMLDCCKDDECTICGVLICPSQEPLHFHHDGCPACCLQETNQ